MASFAFLLSPAPGVAQTRPPGGQASVVVGPDEAFARDAAAYTRLFPVDASEALSRLRAQEASVSATDALQRRFASRLAGISIEHFPEYRFVVLLTGSEPVSDEVVAAAGRNIPVVYRTGARATRDQVVAAMRAHRTALVDAFPRARGMGFDPRTGELVLLVNPTDAAGVDRPAIRRAVETLTGVPVRVTLTDAVTGNLAVGGGSRLEGTFPDGPRRFICTSGFVVTDGSQTALATAAHCPDSILDEDPDAGAVPLTFVGQWGARYQDVQLNASESRLKPVFYANRKAGDLRALTSWRNRVSTRAGDIVCHWGEGSGYSCAEVQLTDFAPPGDLCGGPCEPEWVSVRGPHCAGGDSGGPVFSGTVAFGLLKGGNRTASGSCNFYYYMSIDFLPTGWRLLYDKPQVPVTTVRPISVR